MPQLSFDTFFSHRNQWNCVHRSSVKLCILKGRHPQELLSRKPLTAIFWWTINQLSITPPQTKLQLTWALFAILTHSLTWGVKSHPAFPCASSLQAPSSDHPHAVQRPGTPCSHQSQPTSTRVMQPWADVNRALNLKLEHGWSKPGIFPVSPRKAMLPALCFLVRHVIIWHHLLSSEICWNKRNVELSLRGKNKVYSLKS